MACRPLQAEVAVAHYKQLCAQRAPFVLARCTQQLCRQVKQSWALQRKP